MEQTVGETSESEILRRIRARPPPAPARAGGRGAAAAVLRAAGAGAPPPDTLVHGPDFRLAWSSGRDLGWKSAAVNLADVAAMGAEPTGLLVALAMPADTRIGFVEALADGLRDACEALSPGCAVVGGDLTVSRTLTIAVTAIGDLGGRRPVLRSGANPGDVLAIAGELGLAGRGLRILFDRFRDDGEPVPVDAARLGEGERALLDAQLRPAPPIALGVVAARAGVTAMMDVSDGLVLDARRMARASGVALDLDSAALGDDVAAALTGGEDHALLATFPDGPLPVGFRAIGRVGDGDGEVLIDGVTIDGRGGWDPYADWDAQTG